MAVPTVMLVQVLLSLFVVQLPLIITAGIGIWFSVSRNRLPAVVAKHAKWGFGLLIAHSLVSVTLSFVSFRLRVAARTEAASMMSEDLAWLSLISAGAYPLFIAGIVLIARAVFLGR